jgi:hypothetical protein
MDFGQIKEKLSKKNRAINEKRKGAVVFGCRAKDFWRNGGHTYMTL